MLIAPHYVFPLEFNLLPKPPSPWEASASLIAPLPSWICASDLKTSPSTRVTSRHCVYIAIWNPAEQYSQRCARYLKRESPRMVCLWVLAKLPGNQRVSISHSHGTDSILPETSWGSIVLRKGWQNRSECFLSLPPPPPRKQWDRKDPGAKSSYLRRWHTGWVWICHSMNLKFLDLNSTHRTCPCLPFQEPGSYSSI